MRRLVLLAMGLIMAGCATASEPLAYAADGTPIHGGRFTPTAQDGAVTLNCLVSDQGRLTDCQVVKEIPEGQGFAEAALKAVANGKINQGELRQGQRVEFTTRFRLEN